VLIKPDNLTCYQHAEAAELVGKGYTGFVVRDGWVPYRKFQQAFHQTCLAHLLRRCRDLEEQAGAGGADFPRAVFRAP
jgi:transposase